MGGVHRVVLEAEHGAAEDSTVHGVALHVIAVLQDEPAVAEEDSDDHAEATVAACVALAGVAPGGRLATSARRAWAEHPPATSDAASCQLGVLKLAVAQPWWLCWQAPRC